MVVLSRDPSAGQSGAGSSPPSLVCSVPVPEKNKTEAFIRGVLRSEEELMDRFNQHGFRYQSLSGENGALLYFKATLSRPEPIGEKLLDTSAVAL